MNNVKELLGIALSLLAATLAIVSATGLAIYIVMMVVWFHVPAHAVLTLVLPLLLVTCTLAWLCHKVGIALRKQKQNGNRANL